MRFLVVDDEKLVRNSITEILREEGHQVVEFQNGKEAFLYLEKGEGVDVVISDYHMPLTTGFVLLYLIRKRLNLTEVRFVLLTGDILSGSDKAHLRRYGAKLLHKPFSSLELLSVVGLQGAIPV